MKKKSSLIFLFYFTLVFFLMTACVQFRRDYPVKRYFLLDADRQENALSRKSDAVLTLLKFRASPQYQGKKFVYRKGDLEYVSDFYHEFFISPSLMVTDEVREWLSKSGLFGKVSGFSGQMEPEYLLEGLITELFGDFNAKNESKAVIAIQFSFIRAMPDRLRMSFTKKYHQKVPIKGGSPDALVQGWNEGLIKILSEFEKDLKAYLSQN